MNTVFQLPSSALSLLLILVFIILIFQASVLCAGYFYRIKISHCHILSVLAAVSLLLLSFLSEGASRKVNDEPLDLFTSHIMGIPVFLCASYIIFTLVYAVWILVHVYRHKSSMITVSSIREGADSLPMGLCFSRPSGQPFLVNRKMENLSHSLCGTALQNAEQFWETISHGDLTTGAQRSQLPNGSVLIQLNEGVWSFERQIIHVGSEEVVQLTATDTTDLHLLRAKLNRQNDALQRINTRLVSYGENVEVLAKSRERLAMKIQIHDSIGQNLMRTRYYLTQELDSSHIHNMEHILQKWHHTIAFLRGESSIEKHSDALKHLVEAGKSAGVEVMIEGELPSDSDLTELIAAAGAEALTNAVRHAGATRLILHVSCTFTSCTAVFSNDGRVPSADFREGGGLQGLRHRIEDRGGTMSIQVDPRFILTVSLPVEGKEDKIWREMC